MVLVELSLQSRKIELYKLIALTVWEGNDKNSLEDYILIRKCIFSAISVLKKEYYFKHSGIIPLWFDTKNRVFHFRKKMPQRNDEPLINAVTLENDFGFKAGIFLS